MHAAVYTRRFLLTDTRLHLVDGEFPRLTPSTFLRQFAMPHMSSIFLSLRQITTHWMMYSNS